MFAYALFATIILISACWVVTLHNLFRAALSLGVVLFGVAGIFILLQAEFLAFVQILVYVGAILTMVVFAIMLTARLQTDLASSASRQQWPAAMVALGLFAVLCGATQGLVWPTTAPVEAVSLAAIGQELIKTLALPFEVVSLVLVAAMVGAIVLAAARRRTD